MRCELGTELMGVMYCRYICEISPPRYRGPLTTGPQLLITAGLVVGFFTCYATANMQSTFSWRLPFILLAAYSFAFSAAVLLWLPASPRWLTLRGRPAEASEIWEKLGVPAADREKILNECETAADTNTSTATTEVGKNEGSPGQGLLDQASKPKAKAMMLDLLLDPNARPRLLLAVFVMGMQQLSGIDGVLYVCPPHTISSAAVG
jgi:MFS family permease